MYFIIYIPVFSYVDCCFLFIIISNYIGFHLKKYNNHFI